MSRSGTAATTLAAGHAHVACAQQQKQVTEAEESLARLAAVKDTRAHALKEKKAQQQRLEKAEAPLAACEAAPPTP